MTPEVAEDGTVTYNNPTLLKTLDIKGDPVDLGISQDGRLFTSYRSANKRNFGIFEVDKNTGSISQLANDLAQCTAHPSKFSFIDADTALFVDPEQVNLTSVNLKTDEMHRLVSGYGGNSRGLTVDQYGTIYAEEKMCDGTTTINAFSQQGDVTPFIENLPNPILDMDAANNGIYYLSGPGAFDGSLFHIPTGSNTPQLVAESQNYASVLALPNGNALVWGNYDAFGSSGRLSEISPDGETVQLFNLNYQYIYELRMALSPDGNKVLGAAVLPRNMFNGSDVYVHYIEIDLDSQTVAGVNLDKAQEVNSPYAHADVGLLGGSPVVQMIPNFATFRVDLDGNQEPIIQDMSIDPWSVDNGPNGELYSKGSGGIDILTLNE